MKKIMLSVVILLDVALACGATYSTVIMGEIIGSIYKDEKMKSCLLIYLAILIITAVFSLIRSFIKTKMTEKEIFELKGRCLEAISYARLDWLEKEPYGELQVRINKNVETAAGKLWMSIDNIIYQALIIIAAVIQLFIYDRWMVIIALPLTLVMFLLQAICARPINPRRERLFKVVGENQGFFANIVDSYIVIKVEGIAGKILEKLEEKLSNVQKTFKSVVPIMITAVTIGSFFSMIPTAYMVTRAICIFEDGRIDVASLVTIITLAITIAGIINTMSAKFMDLETKKAAESRVNYCLTAPKDERFNCLKQTGDNYNLIEIDKMSFSFDENIVFSNACAKLVKGENYLILGENGAGKSTLIKILLGFYEVPFEMISYNYKDIEELRLNVSYVDQGFTFLKGNILDNILIDESKDEERVKKLSMLRVFESLKDGINTRVEGDASNLSGGQKKCVHIARGLAKKADIYIFDEPLAGLDEDIVCYVLQDFKKIAGDKEKTLVIISHDLSRLEEEISFHKLKIKGGMINEGK